MNLIPHSRPSIGREEKQAALRVLNSGFIAQGPRVEEFEHRLARSVNRKYGIAVSSGTAALALALKGLGIGEGKDVLVPSYTCAALLHALDFSGARAAVADIDPEDMNLCADSARKHRTRRTATIIVPHLFGRAADMKALAKLGLPILEDGTQALGAICFGKPVGSFGEASVFSFYATKMITTGEGGMIVTDSSKLAARLRDMRDYDKKNNYRFRMNFKMTDLAAALGIEQLKKLPEFIRKRRTIAEEYNQAGISEDNDKSFLLPVTSKERDHVYFRYVVRVSGGAAALIRSLNKKGIEAKSPIFKPLHRYLRLPLLYYPETERALQKAVSIPIFPGLSRPGIHSIANTLKATF